MHHSFRNVMFALVVAGLFPAQSSIADVETAKLITEDAPPVDAGHTEFEFGYQYGTADKSYDNNEDLFDRGKLEGQIFVAKLSRGIRDGFDVSVELSWRDVIKDEANQLGDNIGNLTVTAKWLFHRSKDMGLAIAWLPGFTAPVSGSASGENIAPGQDYWSLNNLLVLTHVDGRFNFNMDVGLFLPVGGDRGDQRAEFIGDVAAGYQATPMIQVFAELNFGQATISGGADSANYAATAGVTWNVKDSMRIDLGLQTVVYGSNADRSRFWLANFSKTY